MLISLAFWLLSSEESVNTNPAFSLQWWCCCLLAILASSLRSFHFAVAVAFFFLICLFASSLSIPLFYFERWKLWKSSFKYYICWSTCFENRNPRITQQCKEWLRMAWSKRQKWLDHGTIDDEIHVKHSHGNRMLVGETSWSLYLQGVFLVLYILYITPNPIWNSGPFIDIAMTNALSIYIDTLLDMFSCLHWILTSATSSGKVRFLPEEMSLSSPRVLVNSLRNMSWRERATCQEMGTNRDSGHGLLTPKPWTISKVDHSTNIVLETEPSVICWWSKYYKALMILISLLESRNNVKLFEETRN